MTPQHEAAKFGELKDAVLELCGEVVQLHLDIKSKVLYAT